MDHVVQFTGPTGTNAVEAAFKLARKVTGRETIISFTNGYHGMTLGALAATGNQHHRGGAGIHMPGIVRMPFDGYLGSEFDTTAYMDQLLTDSSSGVDLPAAVIVETVQGEGGVNAASNLWLQNLQSLCRRHDILLIVDDIQAGCGRTGAFFSFEAAGIEPDMVTLSKSLSGYGLPMSILLIKRDLDAWKPGEHNGTFRGNNLAFVTATATLNHYWADDRFSEELEAKSNTIRLHLTKVIKDYPEQLRLKGRGMFCGIECNESTLAAKVVQQCFEQKLIIEVSGPNDEVLKVFCPLTISAEALETGLNIISENLRAAIAQN